MPLNRFQEKRQITFTPIMVNFTLVSDDQPGKVTYNCNECFEDTTFNHAALYAAAKKDIIQVCKNCKTLAERPYIDRGDNVRECVDCCLVYHCRKYTKYFQCLCKLKTKREEKILYRALLDAGFILSREEYCIEDNNHKVDICAEYQGRTLWIEVDGGSHNSKAQTQLDRQFEEDFKNADYIDEYLIRVHVNRINNEESLAKIVEDLKKVPEKQVKMIY